MYSSSCQELDKTLQLMWGTWQKNGTVPHAGTLQKKVQYPLPQRGSGYLLRPQARAGWLTKADVASSSSKMRGFRSNALSSHKQPARNGQQQPLMIVGSSNIVTKVMLMVLPLLPLTFGLKILLLAATRYHHNTIANYHKCIPPMASSRVKRVTHTSTATSLS